MKKTIVAFSRVHPSLFAPYANPFNLIGQYKPSALDPSRHEMKIR
ncbi:MULTISPECIES: hypothetical protein [Pseudomonas]|jgi:hypothetical protein|nr:MULTISPECIES: hypothetical protein [Pseudomonas]MDD2151898.1 hypothetical protein [Pseudomonas putida]RAS30649.1 hypothetical protein H040_01352 [Pseudomonas sp. URMO17WK12:I7]SMF38676.1 hypothetical protein SAMN02745903_03221 [Pseudomonas sp. URMO17WK12:I5]